MVDINAIVNFDFTQSINDLVQLGIDGRKLQARIKKIREDTDQQRRRIRQLNQEARRLQVLTRGAALSQTQGFGGAVLRRGTEGAQGALFTVISAEAFNRLTGGSSALQSSISGGLTGLVTGGVRVGVLGVIGGLVTGIITEAQTLNAKVDEILRQLDEEAKARKIRERARRAAEEVENRKIREDMRLLEIKIGNVSEDRRLAVLRVQAARGA